MQMDQSRKLFQQAQTLIPGGVNSPVRACQSVGTDPLFIDRAKGCMVYDSDGNEFIDYVGSWGPMILGHAHPAVESAVNAALKNGASFGAPTAMEIELAQLIQEAMPCVEMVRMVNSGTEAVMSAIRLARGVTKRDVMIKFDGCYHGHADSLLVAAGSGVATLAIAGSPGVPQAFVDLTLSLPFNDVETFTKTMVAKGDQVACVIVEPVPGNMGLVSPSQEYLDALRQETEKYGAVLIFDEVMSGFRVAHGGATARYGITPDLVTLGKVIGGGMPVGAYGGKKAVMEKIAPTGPVYQAGTLSGNPLAMAAGIATLSEIRKPGVYEDVSAKADRLKEGLNRAAAEAGVTARACAVGSMFGFFFTDQPVANFEDAKRSDLGLFKRYFSGMRESGIYLAPSQFEAGFVSTAHTNDHINATVAAAGKVLAEIARG